MYCIHLNLLLENECLQSLLSLFPKKPPFGVRGEQTPLVRYFWLHLASAPASMGYPSTKQLAAPAQPRRSSFVPVCMFMFRWNRGFSSKTRFGCNFLCCLLGVLFLSPTVSVGPFANLDWIIFKSGCALLNHEIKGDHMKLVNWLFHEDFNERNRKRKGVVK